jgi:phosphoribosylanthranilate isomerase
MIQADGNHLDPPHPARIGIKICGLTSAAEAEKCAQLGADAVGCVFYPKSPRHVSEDTAADICRAVSPAALPVGVFVDDGFDAIMRKVTTCRLAGVQLHGRETPELVRRLKAEGVLVVKAFFFGGQPAPQLAASYPADAFLMECARGPLPGGNAMVWDWKSASPHATARPLILAGGLSPQNVAEAVAAARPSAVDVSSGVESAPGKKDLRKVAQFIDAIGNLPATATFRVFGSHTQTGSRDKSLSRKFD